MTNHKLSIIAGGFFLAFGLAPESAFAYTKCTITAECLIEIRMAKNEINQTIDSFDRSTTRAIDTERTDVIDVLGRQTSPLSGQTSKDRSEESRVGKECVSKWKSRGAESN